jgi:chemotaxis protein CheC
MTISPLLRDAITELGNIGISRAARQLAVLLDDEVKMDIPQVELVSSKEMQNSLQIRSGELACVYQEISGELSGRAAILVHSEDSRVLFNTLIRDAASLGVIDLRSYEHEALTEIGNIIISSCISAMADMLQQQITISAPRYDEATLDVLFGIDNKVDTNHRALLIHSTLVATRRKVTGRILLLLSAGPTQRILEKLLHIGEKEIVK